MTLSSSSNNKFHEWFSQPINRFQSRDPILFKHQSCRHVEHWFECEICCVYNGLTFVLLIFPDEYCWFHCYSHNHFPNCRNVLSISCNVGCSFLSLPHLIIHPIHEWSWFYRQFQFCFIVSHDKILRSCHFLRIYIIKSPWYITKCFFVAYGLRGSVEKNFFVISLQEVLSGCPDRSYVVASVFHSWEDQAWYSLLFGCSIELIWTPKIQIMYIDTKNQLADILTKEISHVMDGIICCAC